PYLNQPESEQPPQQTAAGHPHETAVQHALVFCLLREDLLVARLRLRYHRAAPGSIVLSSDPPLAAQGIMALWKRPDPTWRRRSGRTRPTRCAPDQSGGQGVPPASSNASALPAPIRQPK